ncbi:5-methylcytosine-specific restriction protein A [Pseudomonas sp. TE6349]
MGTAVEFLRPTSKSMIIDCVRNAGIDVQAWRFRKKDGKPVATPQSNGGYCYEWSFRSDDGSISLLCVWFEEMGIDNQGRVCFAGNLKAYSDTLIRQLEKNPKNRNRTIKDPRISRAQHFSSTVELAHVNARYVRVAIVSGPVREKEDEGSDHDRAIGRQLDNQEWYVESFDGDTGAFLLVRGIRDQGNIETEGDSVQPDHTLTSEAAAMDQFSTDERPDTYTYNGVQRYRDPSVRLRVLKRSGGVCELTNVPGFMMANGCVYLETHHIIPLSEGGADTDANVIALTADAHRQVHYGLDRDNLRTRCLEIVAGRVSR